MPRGPRLDAPGAVHHVMVRGIERREIFRSDRDRAETPRTPRRGGRQDRDRTLRLDPPAEPPSPAPAHRHRPPLHEHAPRPHRIREQLQSPLRVNPGLSCATPSVNGFAVALFGCGPSGAMAAWQVRVIRTIRRSKWPIMAATSVDHTFAVVACSVLGAEPIGPTVKEGGSGRFEGGSVV